MTRATYPIAMRPGLRRGPAGHRSVADMKVAPRAGHVYFAIKIAPVSFAASVRGPPSINGRTRSDRIARADLAGTGIQDTAALSRAKRAAARQIFTL